MGSQSNRVIVYVDGFNLYFGLLAKKWRKYLWLDLKKFAQSLILPNETLVQVKFFTARISGPPAKQRRQSLYLDAVATLTDVSLFYGRYQSQTETCRRCGSTYTYSNEKKTDVNIAAEILVDAFQNKFDAAILVSADSDLTAPISYIRRLFPNRKILVAFPPTRFSYELKGVAHSFYHIAEKKFAASQFPDTVVTRNGIKLMRPPKWR